MAFLPIKRSLLMIASLFLSAAVSYPAGEDLGYKLNSFSLPEFIIRSIPGGLFQNAFFENYAPDATFLIEESNGFSLIDSPRVYYEGDSLVQFNWFYEGFDIHSALDDGSPGVLLPFSAATQYCLQGETPLVKNYGFQVLSRPRDGTFARLRVSTTASDMGGYIPWGVNFVNPHASSANRDDRLYSSRRKILYDYDVDYLYNKRGQSSAFSFAATAFDLQRQFNDFNVFDRTFREKGRGILLNANFEQEFKDGSLFATAVVNDLSRNHFLAELGRLPQETQAKERQSYFAGIRLINKGLTAGLSYLLEKETLTPNDPNFLKDLKDNDGEGLFPFEKTGSFSAGTLRLSLDLRLLSQEKNNKTKIDLFSEFKTTALSGSENAADFNPLSFDNTPALVILWNQGRSYRNVNQAFKAGALLGYEPTPGIAFCAKIVLQNSNARFEGGTNNLKFLTPGFDLGVRLFKEPGILISYEQMPYDLRENVNFFLEQGRPWGTVYRWTDANGDGQYQRGEESEIVGYTGGRFHTAADSLKIPMRKRVLLSLTAPLSADWSFSLKGLFKKIDDNFLVRFKENYGFYENVGGELLYFFSAPYQDYVLDNDPSSKKPYYTELVFQINSRENTTWFFSFSFCAHIGMGRTMFGNGPGAGDIGLLSESQADPNALLNSYGRVDGDRAYLGKLFFGVALAKNLFLSANFKYRDGTPFAFLDEVERYDQIVITYKTIKGDNEKGLKGGPRKDYLTDISLKLTYKFNLFGWNAEAELSAFNLLDFGSELSEYVFSGGRRLANELQIPRSLRLGLSMEF
jgi:hypothetical protein